MENFIVSARKYRPVTFDTVVGQPSITTTLKNAIRTNHLAQAYLFTGPRGVGKTTTARILAKTINCLNLSDSAEACNACDSCNAFNESRSLNIFELDAASNNSVDDIRALVDQVRYAPQLGKYKVYIIDEVHMLSQSAFNAFLKTLEEPPAHAVFILATTEKHKILPTILSRCQIFDFSRISVPQITNHLADIAQKENVNAEEDALHIIAQKSDGSLRDALSLFDQIVSFAGENLKYKDVIANLNILDYDYYFKITDELLSENIPASLVIYNEIIIHGFDGHNFISGLASHFRDLLVCTDEITLPLLEVSSSVMEKYKVQSRNCSPAWLLNGLEITNTADYQYKAAKHQRLHIELALIRLCMMNAKESATGTPVKKKVESTVAKSVSLTEIKHTAESVQENQVKPVGKEVAAASEKSESIPASSSTPPVEKKNTFSGSAKKTISITGTLNSRQESVTIQSQTEKVSDPAKKFTSSDLYAAWEAYANLLQQQGRPVLHAALSKRKPELSENFKIHFKVDSTAVEKDLNELKPELLGFIRRNLSNNEVDLFIEVILGDDTGLVPYTPSEKFKKLAKKNPLLNDMKNQFDLEIEY